MVGASPLAATPGSLPQPPLQQLCGRLLVTGKTVPIEVAQAALARYGKLGPDSCGWHYVEGLTEADDPEIAILWDKVGLGTMASA